MGFDSARSARHRLAIGATAGESPLFVFITRWLPICAAILRIEYRAIEILVCKIRHDIIAVFVFDDIAELTSIEMPIAASRLFATIAINRAVVVAFELAYDELARRVIDIILACLATEVGFVAHWRPRSTRRSFALALETLVFASRAFVLPRPIDANLWLLAIALLFAIEIAFSNFAPLALAIDAIAFASRAFVLPRAIGANYWLLAIALHFATGLAFPFYDYLANAIDAIAFASRTIVLPRAIDANLWLFVIASLFIIAIARRRRASASVVFATIGALVFSNRTIDTGAQIAVYACGLIRLDVASRRGATVAIVTTCEKTRHTAQY